MGNNDDVPPWAAGPCTLRDAVAWARRHVIAAALARNGGSVGRAAGELGIDRTHLFRLQRKGSAIKGKETR